MLGKEVTLGILCTNSRIFGLDSCGTYFTPSAISAGEKVLAFLGAASSCSNCCIAFLILLAFLPLIPLGL